MKITRRQLRDLIAEAAHDDEFMKGYDRQWRIRREQEFAQDPAWDSDADTNDPDNVGSQDMADAKRYAGHKGPEGMAKYLGISVEDWHRIRAELDDHYEDRFLDDQMAFEDDPESERHPLDVDGDGKLTISETQITRKQLRQMIMESMSLLQEEDYDCIRDYKRMGYTHAEAVKMCGGGKERYFSGTPNKYGHSRDSRRRSGGYRSQRPASSAQSAIASQIKDVLDNMAEGLTDWEKNFLRSVHSQLTQRGRQLSSKQSSIVKRILKKFDTGINPGDGKLTDDEADLMQDLVSDAAEEEKEDLSEITMTRDEMLHLIRSELEDSSNSESEFLTVQPQHKPMRRRGGG